MTTSGCFKKKKKIQPRERNLLRKKKHLIVGILASCFTGPRLFPGTHKCMYFISRSLSPSCCYKSVLCCPWVQSDPCSRSGVCGSQRGLTLRSPLPAAETMTGRGLAFWVLCFGFKEKRSLLQRKCSELCRNTGFYTILKENLGGFLGIEKKLLKLGS